MRTEISGKDYEDWEVADGYLTRIKIKYDSSMWIGSN